MEGERRMRGEWGEVEHSMLYVYSVSRCDSSDSRCTVYPW